jgi:tetratricopeptide (TPR) repeat protein
VLRQLSASILCFAVWSALLAGNAAPTPPESASPCDRVVALLHDGRFDAADEALQPFLRGEPDPGVAFFHAFVTYWRLLYDDENPALRSEFETRLDRAVSIAEARIEAGAAGDAASGWAGSARLLRAQLYATEGHPFKAAFEAKRARRLLEDAIVRSRGTDEPYFALGAYNYYASQVSAIVKGLRFLLALPGGNRERGLRYLERAAEGGSCVSLEARLLLATILSDDHEREFRAALSHLRLAAGEQPEAIAVLHASARLDLALARPERAAERLDRALARASQSSGTDPAVLATLRYHRARAELAGLRPDLAVEILRPLIEGSAPLPLSLRSSVDRLTESCIVWSGRPAWMPPESPAAGGGGGKPEAPEVKQFRTALRLARPAMSLARAGDPGRSAEMLAGLSNGQPHDPALALLAGHAALRVGRGQDAIYWLSRAERSPELPEEWRGPCRLLAGQAADLNGDRVGALRYYRKAASARGFIGKDAAYLYQRERYTPDAEAAIGAAATGSGP